MVKIAPIDVAQLADAVGGTVALNRGEATSLKVTELGEPLEVGAEGVAFIISEGFVRDVPRTRALVLVIQQALAEGVKAQLPESVKVVVTAHDAYLGLANLSRLIAERDGLFDWPFPAGGAASGEVDPTARIAPGAIVSPGARVGARTVVLGGAVIGPGATVGADCMIYPGVVLYPRTVIGDHVRVHANCVLGSDGFGYARGPQGSVKIWHLGRVIVEDDVEIGAGTTIDRGTLKDTVIERGAKIDNLVQIGHNGHVKSHAILCAQVGMAGNVTIGRGAILAGKVGVADKIEIGDGAIVGPMSGLSKDVNPGEIVMGTHPAKPRRQWWKLMALIERLPDLFDRVKKLEGRQS